MLPQNRTNDVAVKNLERNTLKPQIHLPTHTKEDPCSSISANRSHV